MANKNFTNVEGANEAAKNSRQLILKSAVGMEEVRFQVVPRITEARSATYVNEGVPTNFPVVVYTVTNGRTYTISGQMISRTPEEADSNFKMMLLIKTWVLPETEKVADESPVRLKMLGWGTLFNRVYVSLQSYNFNFPDDVDYVQGSTLGAYMPIVLPFSLSLFENQPEDNRTKFNINDYRAGTAMGY